MKLSLNKEEFNLLQIYLAEECGIALSEDNSYLIEARLADLVLEMGCESYADFYRMISKRKQKFTDKITAAMIPNETLWFRDEWPFKALHKFILPEYVQMVQNDQKRECRICSVGCSTGQEAYSAKITALEYFRQHPQQQLPLSISGFDISMSNIVLARAGRFNEIAMSRGLRPDYRKLYFQKQGNIYFINNEVKEDVNFECLNIFENLQNFAPFDVFFLRNILIYLTKDFKKKLLCKIAELINPGGYLFLGATEFIFGISDQFQIVNHGPMLFYRTKE